MLCRVAVFVIWVCDLCSESEGTGVHPREVRREALAYSRVPDGSFKDSMIGEVTAEPVHTRL